MHTFVIDFISPFKISPAQIKQAVDHVAPLFLEGGEELGFFWLWEKQEFDISIPQQFCFFGRCWTPPWAGSTLLVVYRYRLWIISRILVMGSEASRPMLPALSIIAIFAGICLVIATIASVVFFAEGKITAEQVADGVQGIVKAPGENIKAALSPLTWAGLGVGLLLIGWGLALPYLQPRVTATVPVGSGRVTAGVTGAPAQRR